MEKLFVSFVVAVGIFGVFCLGGSLVLELFKHYGTSAILALIAFIGLWILAYLIVTD